MKKSRIWAQLITVRASLVAQSVKNLPAVQETQVQFLGWEDPLEKEMATHSSILAWKISWTEEPDGLQSRGLQRVEHDWVTNTYTYLITVNTQKRILLNTPLSFHLIFRKGSYYETVNIIGLKIPGNLVHGVREDTTIVKCNEVGLYVFFQFVISFQSYYFTLTDNLSSVKKKLPLTFTHFLKVLNNFLIQPAILPYTIDVVLANNLHC